MFRRFAIASTALMLMATPVFAHGKHATTATPEPLNAAVPGLAQALYGGSPSDAFNNSIALISTADGCGVISDADAMNLINEGAKRYAGNQSATFYSDLIMAFETGMSVAQQKNACKFFLANPAITLGIQGTSDAAKNETFIP